MKHIILFVLMSVLFISCHNESKIESHISKIKMDVVIERFDLAFGQAKPNELSSLKKAYPFMFSTKYPDSFWISQMQDSNQVDLNKGVVSVFPDLKTVNIEIVDFFKHIKYYFPEFNAPRVITATSFVDYRNKVIVTDTIALISIDTYLGSDHELYDGIQNYLKANFKEDQIVVDLAADYAKHYIFPQRNKSLLQEMIYFGKQLYFKDLMIPFKTDAEKIGYSQEQLDWATINEEEIWSYFVERELLFSTDAKLPNRFINPAPFSKFNLVDIDKESPGRIGQYIGWKIVRAYMKNNEVSLKDMLTTQAEDIFNKSNFKPLK